MTDYEQLLNAVEQYYGSGSDQWAEIAKYGVASENAESILSQVPGVNIVKNANGKIRSYNFAPTENIVSGAEQAVNSNTPAVIKSFEVPANTAVDTAGKMTFKSGMAQAGSFVFTEVVPAIAAAGAGITLGKTFDKVLYSANPDFWDEHGMSTLDPDTWGNIIGTDSFGGRVMNMILGTTPDHKTQAYIDQNALAYMALYEKNKGVFDTSGFSGTPSKIEGTENFNYTGGATSIRTGYYHDNEYIYTSVWQLNPNKYPMAAALKEETPPPWRDSNHTLPPIEMILIYKFYDKCYSIFDKNSPIAAYKLVTQTNYSNGTISSNSIYSLPWSDTYGGMGTPHDYKFSSNISFNIPLFNTIAEAENYLNTNDFSGAINKGLDGIGKQDNAKTPDLSGATTVQETLDALKQQYPALFDQAVTQDVVQPDGSTVTYTYVPIAVPELDPEGNPISSLDPEGTPIGSTQANPQIDPATAPEPLLKLITTLIQKDPPVNPPDTGSGDSPAVVPPSGSASALYAIYNPTLAQINAFGAWLWSDNFVDQIKKLFNDPMQAIIGLHKVYATPATSGTQNIKVGYLDSGVSANVVSSQYTTIDCGTVTLSEYFHNVFDYAPYTQINLYLPFIGIVSLDNADVMRASIHIVYHVDVLSGACLAEVKVTRDGAGGTLYQYTGNASVTLPISSGSYMGIVTSIASIAGGIAGTIASGGAALPMLASAAGSALNARAKVEHSGGFSGNAGAMGGKTPYLIISRPQVALANNFQKYIGFPANYTTNLSACSGFVKVLECHIENVNATSSELTEIESLLKEGVLV